MSLDQAVLEKRNTLKTDRLDMSFGELMNMFEDGDLFITPEYQRAFSNFAVNPRPMRAGI
ncbi:hypothetical protein HZS38_05980 [Xenorhabdus nematophila]|uniref:Uncharacterized protein n=1 Tax=Xenorhabdus nematophila (strain ATCC 19061 / DSM 3370 / CCUG 14189 / LMG 1036 / NCIMB 9965 / AN6) TaxID=406817 RepID=D3VHB8_XENNA|nr:hypothetical protein [Xenorhabdus nematophila]AYA40086.1 hypothetical protein D3790_06105 [Xenorhabdus nematophila]KHD29510.1 hypothetical protein LH67_02455 [Xenorhabdus nematophila]MBA0018733.1 hypothetical protein [Xenorhabdus nematophila]MCB4425301.1 hypothetical protein [Xenorhabdus nematophila]QNJ37732.1 hypothetical protein H8F46_06040 [Xenorhabdus nematophila]